MLKLVNKESLSPTFPLTYARLSQTESKITQNDKNRIVFNIDFCNLAYDIHTGSLFAYDKIYLIILIPIII